MYTGPGKRMVPRLREFFRQGQAEVVSNSKNKILATWEPFFCRALYYLLKKTSRMIKIKIKQCLKTKSDLITFWLELLCLFYHACHHNHKFHAGRSTK